MLQKVPARTGVQVLEMAVDWYNPGVVWLGLSNGDVLKSEDGGRTWRTVLNTKKDITAIMISQTDSRRGLVGTDTAGFYKTDDAGATWTQVVKELKDFRNGDNVLSLVQDAKSEVVIAATQFGLLRSRDFGSTWEKVSLLTSPGQVAIRALAIDPNNANRIYYAASATFYTSADGGNTWTTSRIPTTRVPEAMLVDPSKPSTVYVGVATVEKK